MKVILAVFLVAVLLLPPTASAASVGMDVHIRALPTGNHTALFNIVDSNNSWLDNRRIWEGFRTDGRISGEGVIPNLYNITDFNVSGIWSRVSTFVTHYLTEDEVMSGSSDTYIRLPIATNAAYFSVNTEMCVKLYAIEGSSYTVHGFNYTDVDISSYSTTYLLYSWNGTMKEPPDIETQTYQYPANITTVWGHPLNLTIYYLHLRGPLLSGTTYILFQSIRMPAFSQNRYFVLGSYRNETGFYYNGQIETMPVAPSWSILARVGLSEGIYSMEIPQSSYPTVYVWQTQNLSEPVHIPGSKYYNVNATAAVPVYSDNYSNLTLLVTFYTDQGFHYQIGGTYALAPGLNNLIINGTFTTGLVEENITSYTLTLNSTDSGIFLYLAKDPGAEILSTRNITTYPYTEVYPYYHASQILAYVFASLNSSIVFDTFNFAGINRPIVFYNVTYVYDLLDLPITVYRAQTAILTNIIYFATWGQVDLRYLYSEDFILNMAKEARAVIDMISAPIGFLLDHTVHVLIPAIQYYGEKFLSYLVAVLAAFAFFIFLWPWLVLVRGFFLFQDQGVDAMLDYYAAAADRITSIARKLGGGKK